MSAKPVNRFIAAFALVVIGCAIVFGIRNDIRKRYQQAILAVLNQENKAMVQKRTTRSGNVVIFRAGQKGFSPAVCLAELQRISIGACPKEFQFAWLDCLQTLSRKNEPLSGLGSRGEYIVSMWKGSPDAARDALERLDKMNVPEAEMRLDKVALEYGVQIMPAPGSR